MYGSGQPYTSCTLKALLHLIATLHTTRVCITMCITRCASLVHHLCITMCITRVCITCASLVHHNVHHQGVHHFCTFLLRCTRLGCASLVHHLCITCASQCASHLHLFMLHCTRPGCASTAHGSCHSKLCATLLFVCVCVCVSGLRRPSS